MLIAFWLPPIVKALATVLLVTSASVLAEALGPFWGALIASLPVSAGPAYVFLALAHDPEFVAASALGSFAANAATGLFLIVYSALAGRRRQASSLGLAVLVWFAASWLLHQFVWTAVTALSLNVVVYGAGLIFSRRTRFSAAVVASPIKRKKFDIPARAVAVAAFVSVVVAASSFLGAAATGIAAVFPISLISLIVIVRPRIGGPASGLLAANALRSMFGFGLMLLTLHLALTSLPTPTAFLLALAVSGGWSIGLLFFRPKAPAARTS